MRSLSLNLNRNSLCKRGRKLFFFAKWRRFSALFTWENQFFNKSASFKLHLRNDFLFIMKYEFLSLSRRVFKMFSQLARFRDSQFEKSAHLYTAVLCFVIFTISSSWNSFSSGAARTKQFNFPEDCFPLSLECNFHNRVLNCVFYFALINWFELTRCGLRQCLR